MINSKFWNGKRVIVTGHTGFKGGWLVLWLKKLGADITGISLEPNTKPNLYTLAKVGKNINSHFHDIRDNDGLNKIIKRSKAEIIIHLAAQPLVRQSYSDPIGTLTSNVIGTANVLEAAKKISTVKVVQVITTDKCYKNQEWLFPYRETDRLGGHDPYSTSKACVELIVDSYRSSFFCETGVSVSTARAGNVIGGGDWSIDRIIPDCVRAITAGAPLSVRFPSSIRPWQHVLEPLSGYLMLAQKQWGGDNIYSGAFNFGPNIDEEISVGKLTSKFSQIWNGKDIETELKTSDMHEAKTLKLDTSKARHYLNWSPKMKNDEMLELTVDWYKRVILGEESALNLCNEQILKYENLLTESCIE